MDQELLRTYEVAEVPFTAPLQSQGRPIAAGQVIGERYRVGQLLGEGGMGLVFDGTHVLLGTPVAIKLIHSELKDYPEAVQRFLNVTVQVWTAGELGREGRSSRRDRHPPQS